MTSIAGEKPQQSLKKSLFTVDIGVQTEVPTSGVASSEQYETNKADSYEDQESSLTASDLASILKWSKDISSDINLSSGMFLAEPTYTQSNMGTQPYKD